MALADADGLAVALRMLVYAGTVLAAGSALFRASFPALPGVAPALRLQLWLGAALLIICEPLRYMLFLLQIAGGDLSLGLSSSMRWIGIETPLGQSAGVRLAAVAILLCAGLRWRLVGLGAAALMIGSYLIEGHTVSSEARAFLAPLLFAHLFAVHWWIGGLPGLFAAARAAQAAQLAQTVRVFGNAAAWSAGVLIIAGSIVLAVLTGWQLDLGSGYQQAFVLKLAAVSLILLIAAINRWRLTPRLMRDADAARPALRASLVLETGVAAAILLATALAIGFAPQAP